MVHGLLFLFSDAKLARKKLKEELYSVVLKNPYMNNCSKRSDRKEAAHSRKKLVSSQQALFNVLIRAIKNLWLI